ncbi:MAG: hypothetical protein NXI32_26255 [bacterium]|nr:hypothetical protein [bacterium]
MRKILSFQRTKSTVRNVIRGVAFGATIAVTFGLSSGAHAQTMAEQLAPTATGLQGSPVSNAVANNDQYPMSVNDAGYSVLSDNSQVEPAQFLGEEFFPTGNYGYGSPCDPGCDVSAYGRVEALYYRRQGDKYFTPIRNAFLDEFAWQEGVRVTLGCLMNCTNGYELSYIGPFEWERQATLRGNGNLQSLLRPSNGYTFNDIDTFFDADVQGLSVRSKLNSIEANYRWWAWDAFSTLVGLRYINFEEEYSFSSAGANGAGIHFEGVDNQMAGIQIGADWMYPFCIRGNSGFRGKGGVYANVAERRSLLINDGTLLINAGDSSTDWAGVFEFGWFANYYVIPQLRFSAGYDFWWMTQMATISEQRPTSITPATGTTVFSEDDVLVHGASLGVELIF